MPNEIFCCYAHEDQKFLQELREHLSELQRQGLVTLWSDTDISPGANWKEEINKHLNTAQIFLLLISSNFIASDYCNSTEIKRAMERHQNGEARVIPIIIRPTFWERATFSQFQALPKDAKPVTSWQNRDEAFLDVVRGIRKVIEELTPESLHPPKPPQPTNRTILRLPISRRLVVMALGGLGLLVTGGAYIGFQLIMQVTGGTSRILYTPAHNSNVNYIMWSPKGPYLAIANGDWTASVLDTTNGALLLTYRQHSYFVNAIAWSPDGQEIASASADKTVQIWNAKIGATRLTYHAPSSVWAVGWSPNGAHIASAGRDDNSTQIWDANTGQVVTLYRGPTGNIWAVAWSHDSERIATGYADGTIYICSASDGHLLLAYHGQSSTIYEIMWSTDDRSIVSASGDNTVHIWNSTNGTSLRAYGSHSAPVHGAEWSPDGTLIASVDAAGVIQIWNATTGETLHTYRTHPDIITSLAWSPNGMQIVSGSDNGTIRLWNVK